jgi:2'-5' RNA ligase
VSAPPLAALARAVDVACAGQSFPREARPFRPHVTLGRVREGRGPLDPAARRIVADAASSVLGRSPVDELVLFRSELSPRGARYTALARAPLGGSATG